MKIFFIMDLLKIFRMQEPVPKDLLAKNSEIGKYKEVVQEKDVLLRNSKARVRELEQQVLDLETKNRTLENQVKASDCKNMIKEYELFFCKIMADSQELIQQKNLLEFKFNEMECFSKDILEKYEKSKEVIIQYENVLEKLKKQILEYEDIINSLTNEYNRIKDYFQTKVGDAGFNIDKGFPEDFQHKFKDAAFKDVFLPNEIYNNKLQKQILEKRCTTFIFEPLQGLDKQI